MNKSPAEVKEIHELLWKEGHQNGAPNRREIASIHKLLAERRGISSTLTTQFIKQLIKAGRLEQIEGRRIYIVIDPDSTAFNQPLKNHLPAENRFHRLIGSASFIEKIKEFVLCVAPTNKPVLLTGETGAGKDLLAQAIHAESGRGSVKNYHELNCTAVAGELIESELFGHKKGSFTSAVGNHKGLFKRADKGTVLLDEIGYSSLQFQAKILRFLDTGEFLPVGADKKEKVNVRLIAATNCDLEEMIAKRQFRKDLYYRLRFLAFHIPPLRERAEDLESLVNCFLSRISLELGREVPELSENVWQVLRRHDWPGNVRELHHRIEAAIILSQGREITPSHLGL